MSLVVVPNSLADVEYSLAFPGLTIVSVPLSAVGGTPPYTFALISGALPAGLSLSDGIISGTPTSTVGSVSTGTIQVTDSLGATATMDFSITTRNCDPYGGILNHRLAWWGSTFGFGSWPTSQAPNLPITIMVNNGNTANITSVPTNAITIDGADVPFTWVNTPRVMAGGYQFYDKLVLTPSSDLPLGAEIDVNIAGITLDDVVDGQYLISGGQAYFSFTAAYPITQVQCKATQVLIGARTT